MAMMMPTSSLSTYPTY